MWSSAFLKYEVWLAFGWSAILPIVILPFLAVFGLIVSQQNGAPGWIDLIAPFEMGLSLAVAFAAAYPMTIEREEQFDELRRTYPEPSWRVPVSRMLLSCVLALLFLGAGLISYRLTYGLYNLWDVLYAGLPPTIYLMGLALLLSNITGNSWITIGMIFIYWLIEMQTLGQHTGILFLFNSTYPIAELDSSLNRAVLVLLGTGFLAGNTAFSAYRRRGGVKGR